MTFDEVNKPGVVIRAEQVRLIFEALPLSQLMVLLVATSTAVFFWPVIGPPTIVTWLASVYVIAALRLLLWVRYRQADPIPEEVGRWALYARVGATFGALVWGAAGYFLFVGDSLLHQGFLALVVAGVTAGGVMSHAAQRDSVVMFALIAMAPLLYRFAEHAQPPAPALPLMVLLFTVFVVVLGLRINQSLTELVTERYERRLIQSRERRRNEVLELLAKGAGLNKVLEAIILGIEAENPRMRGSILLLDEAGTQLFTAAAPSLPDKFNRVIDGLEVGPGRGSCGACAYTHQRIVVENIATHPFWVGFREPAAEAGLAAAWSEPVFSASGELLGTFAIYHQEPHRPTPAETSILEKAAHLAGIAIERGRTVDALRLAALVYENSSEAVMITDEGNRIISINPAFARMTGYSRDEVLGKDPRVLQSDRQDAEFYRSMWEELERTGRWQGEIWNRRKDGNDYAEWLTINTVLDSQTKVHRRVALFSDVTEKKRTDALIWNQANNDPLTNLPNRRLFLDRLEHGIKMAQRGKTHLAVFYIDLDRFKEVNDALGHLVGDQLLVEAARRIKACVRDADTVARLGGDEFTVILHDIDDPGSVGGVAQKIISVLGDPYVLGNEQAFVSGSVGITIYPDDGSNAMQLLKNADQAMFAAKQQGRNRFSYFTAKMLEEAQQRMRLLSDLHRALDANEFHVVYQPIVDLATGRIDRAEALVRWDRPGEGEVDPADFMPVAEETGLIHQIGTHTFKETMAQARRWRDGFNPEFQVSVNRSPVQFLGEGPDDDEWVEHLRALNLPGNALTVEISERALFKASENIQENLLRLRKAGVHIAIDDFGTGYFSLAYLKRFDVLYLKIDRSLVSTLETDATSRALSEAIVMMAHKLGFKVVAEGVEAESQRAILEEIGCDLAQGNLFSEPVPAAEFDALLAGANEHGDTRRPER